MHWRFGGNLEPVQMICETDWKECPKAVANYFWGEIVTDVLDCLSTEGMVWRLLAIFFTCGVILRQVYSKKRNFHENMLDKEVLNKVGYKVEDLELKVNILTYKIQYGTWPSPHQIHKSGFNKGLRNVRLTLSSSNDYNEWIKNIMLSPRRNGSCYSHPRDSRRLTELFDAKRKKAHPYFQRDKLLTTYSSSKSSKSSSGRMDLVESTSREKGKFSKSENFDVQHRNTISLRHRPRRKSTRSTSKIRIHNDTNVLPGRNDVHPSENLTKRADERKVYLREFRDSKKSLALPCSSSEISDAPSIQNIWPERQPPRRIMKTNVTNEAIKSANAENERGKNSNANIVKPVVSFLDANVLPSKLNITFCTELLPQPTLMNVSISPRFKQEDVTQKPFETLYLVKEKLNSLQNVLRAYDVQSAKAKATENQTGEDHKMHDVRQNVMSALVSITTEIENLNEKKKSKVSFEMDMEPNNNETPGTAYNSCEPCQSDDTNKTSGASTQNYSHVFESHRENDDRNFRARERIPERIYYTFSTDSFKENDVGEQALNLENLQNKCSVKNDDEKSMNYHDQFPVSMDTEEDLIILSPVSSRAETSRDSEFDDKSTAVLLREALQFKQALLTRVELEEPCSKRESEKFDLECGPSVISNTGNKLKSNLLDIILEEQSASSSAEKTNRTFVFLNVEKENNLSIRPNVVNDLLTPINQNMLYGGKSIENIKNNNDELDSRGSHYNEDTNKLSNNLQIRYLNTNTLDCLSDEKLVDVESLGIFKNMHKEKRMTSSFCDDEEANNFMSNENQDRVSVSGSFGRRNANHDFTCAKDSNCSKFKDTQIFSESLKDDANFTLKRQHGMCSLIKQTLPAANSTSKENLVEMCSVNNPPQFCAQTSMNSDGLKSPRKMLLNEKSANKEDVISRHDIESNHNVDYDDGEENNVQTFSDNTIILHKSYREEERTCSENMTGVTDRKLPSVLSNQDEKGPGHNISSFGKCNAERNREGTTYDAGLSKSYFNLNSPHNSSCFTDVASSSTAKLNSSNLGNFYAQHDLNTSLEELPVEHLDNTRRCDDGDVQVHKLSKNYDTVGTAPDLNFHADSGEEHLYPDRNIEDKIAVSDRHASSEGSVNDVDCRRNAHLLPECELRMVEHCESTTENINLYKVEAPHTNEANRDTNHVFRISSEYPRIISKETENSSASIFLSNTSPRQVSPSNIRTSIMGKKLGKSRSKSQECKVSKPEKNANDVTSRGSRFTHFTPTNLRNFSTELPSDVEVKNSLRKNRSKSQLSVRKVECSSRYINPRSSESTRNISGGTKHESSIESKSKVKATSKSLLPIPKTSSKSCIPVLKSRLEAARRTETETRPRSPVRGPLTVTTLWRDDLCDRDEAITEDIVQAEGTSKVKSECADRSGGEKATDEENDAKKQHLINSYSGGAQRDEATTDTSVIPQERMVIYINIFTKYDQNTTRIVDPNKFLEYVKDRHLTATDDENLVATPSTRDKKRPSVATEKQENAMRKVLTILSSIVNETDLNPNSHAAACNSNTANTLPANTLSGPNFTNVCFFTVGQREIDITAKPSVTDTSTSISDLKCISDAARTAISNVQICGIPKELTKNEYITLFEALNHESNFAHLHQLQCLCRKLISKYPNVSRP